MIPNKFAMETAIGICMGIGLAAACGFRVFVPLLVLSLGANAGLVHLSHEMAWLSSSPAVIALAVACIVEIAAYWVPSIDHALDAIASPAAVVAGTLAATSQMGDMGPALTWVAGAVAGGTTAAAAQTMNVGARGVGTVATAGIFNPFISAVQSVLSVVVSVLSIVVPVFAAVIGLGIMVFVVRKIARLVSSRPVGVNAAA